MAKHSPGPWWWQVNCLRQADTGEIVIGPTDDKDGFLDRCRIFGSKEDLALIAAAPEMLDLLREVVDVWDGVQGQDDTEVHLLVQRVRAFLKERIGGSPAKGRE